MQRILTDFQELHGDRLFGDDPAIVCGMGRIDGKPVMLIGEQKGRDTKQKLYRNFGMPKPEGYRKALRAMQMAAKFGRPIITFLDTPGAYPGIDAEERGQAEAIARNLREMARLSVPLIAVCIGEGGSGGALALGVANQVFMLENAVYSVITPESCASIIYRDAGKAEQAAAALKLAAPDMLALGLIDGIIPEPAAGAHEDHDEAARLVKEQLVRSLDQLSALTSHEVVQKRYEKFRKMGNFFTGLLDDMAKVQNQMAGDSRHRVHRGIHRRHGVFHVRQRVRSSARSASRINGKTNCGTSAAATREQAERTALDLACDRLGNGMTELGQCRDSRDQTLTWK